MRAMGGRSERERGSEREGERERDEAIGYWLLVMEGGDCSGGFEM
jgi:hypothetical protein